MALETANFISDLVAANPTATDPKSQGDDHVRLVKTCVKATFPNFTAVALQSTQAQIDKLVTAVVVNAAAGAGSVIVTAAGNVGVNVTPTYRFEANQGGSSGAVVDVARFFCNAGSTASARVVFGTTANGVNAGIFGATSSATGGALVFQTAQEGTGTLTTRQTLDSSGNIIGSINAASPSLTGNLTMVFSLPSDSQLRVSVRGSDGVTRTANIALS